MLKNMLFGNQQSTFLYIVKAHQSIFHMLTFDI